MLVDGGSTAQLMNASGLFRGKMYENARAGFKCNGILNFLLYMKFFHK